MKKCLICNKEFLTLFKNQTCSHSCNTTLNNRTENHNFKINNPGLIKLECDKCNRTISKPNYKSHYKKCNGISLCLNCNLEIKGGKFCGSSCAASFNNRNRTKKLLIGKKSFKKRDKPCKYCGSLKQECKRKDICKKAQILPSLIKYFGFNQKLLGSEKYYEEFDRIYNILYEDYIINELSTVDMQVKYNCLNQRVINSLKTLKIDIRKPTVANSIAILKGKGSVKSKLDNYKQFKTCYHTTWNNKTFFLRSSYELDYAKQLDEEKINYEVECLRILYWDSQLLRQRIAIPDFYLPDTNTIIEIKSNYTLDEQNMRDKFKTYKEHGYICKLILNKKEITF